MAAVTRRNVDKSLFLKMLPLEVRCSRGTHSARRSSIKLTVDSNKVRGMIYEYALTVAEDIVPRQSTRHSYKFCWGQAHEHHFSTNNGESRVDLSPIGNQLTVVQLERSCYSIRKDLEYHSVFYKLNTFRFYHSDDLLRYLVSITPEKREQLRSISLELSIPSAAFGIAGVRAPSLALLEQCTGVENLALIVDIRSHYARHGLEISSQIERAISVVDTLKSHINTSSNNDAFHMFKLPQASVLLRVSPSMCLSTTDTVPTPVDNNTPWSKQNDDGSVQWLSDHKSFLRCFARFYQVIKDHKSMSQADWKRVKESITLNDIRLANVAADIDLPGNARVIGVNMGQGNMSRSTRTRNKILQSDKHDEFGVLSHRNDKYDADGLLLWNFTVTALRWNGSEIEFEATYPKCVRQREPSWESLIALPTQHKQGFGRIASFYRTLNFRPRALDDPQYRKMLKSVPEPAAVIRVCFDDEVPRRWKTLQSSFKKNQTRLRKYEAKAKIDAEETSAEEAEAEEDSAEGE